VKAQSRPRTLMERGESRSGMGSGESWSSPGGATEKRWVTWGGFLVLSLPTVPPCMPRLSEEYGSCRTPRRHAAHVSRPRIGHPPCGANPRLRFELERTLPKCLRQREAHSASNSRHECSLLANPPDHCAKRQEAKNPEDDPRGRTLETHAPKSKAPSAASRHATPAQRPSSGIPRLT